MHTFSLACDLETKQLVWSCLMFEKQLKNQDEIPLVHNSAFLAGTFGRRYCNDVKKVTF